MAAEFKSFDNTKSMSPITSVQTVTLGSGLQSEPLAADFLRRQQCGYESLFPRDTEPKLIIHQALMGLKNQRFSIMVKLWDDQNFCSFHAAICWKFFNETRKLQHNSTSLFPGTVYYHDQDSASTSQVSSALLRNFLFHNLLSNLVFREVTIVHHTRAKASQA